jgi:hypothetical protein
MASQYPGDPDSSPPARLHRWLSELHRRFRDRYRPELHYMRGPGPKWREKQSSASGPAPAPSP